MESVRKIVDVEIEELRARLEEAENTLSAIRMGEVDALVITGPAGEQVFTLKGADHAYRIIVEQMSEAALTLSMSGTILYCNSRFAELVKAPLDEIIGNSFTQYLLSDDSVCSPGWLDERDKRRAETTLKTCSEDAVPVYLSCSRVQIDNCPAVCVIVTDLAEQKCQESLVAEERRRAAEKIRENDRLAAMGMTAAALAHEIANPLQWMLSTVQLMQEDVSSPEGGEVPTSWNEHLEDMQNEIGRLATMLQDFRALARPVQVKLASVNLRALIADVRKVIVPQLSTGGICIEYDMPAELPQVYVDPEKLRQVLLNLCNNAIEAMPSGGTLTLKAYAEADEVIIEIIDTGSGIPAGFDVFEPFATTKEKGTGLGLMIVRQILAAHHGSVTYESDVGKGTTFRVTLPLGSAND
jgi:C4-dicarboxylate-specific signal transduction histidine kinase